MADSDDRKLDKQWDYPVWGFAVMPRLMRAAHLSKILATNVNFKDERRAETRRAYAEYGISARLRGDIISFV